MKKGKVLGVAANSVLARVAKRYDGESGRSFDTRIVAQTVDMANAADLVAIIEMASVALRSKFSGR